MRKETRLNRRDFLRLSTAAMGGAVWAASVGVSFSGPATAFAKGGSPYVNPFAQWSNGPNPHPDPTYFPIGVWLQEPSLAPQYQAIGVNFYSGLYQGPTEEQLATLKSYDMPVICAQNDVGLAHRDDPTIIGWFQEPDEPDNAQPAPGGGYGPFVDPSVIIEHYHEKVANDPSRPVLLNLGQGVANDDWIGHGPGFSLDLYAEYLKGTDIAAYDVYPVANGLPLWYAAKGVDRLRDWGNDRKIVWEYIEASNISSDRIPTPEQIRSEVWMALIHGARGFMYFAHRFVPEFDAAYMLHNDEIRAGVAEINQQVHSLAPILNTPTIAGEVTVNSSNPDVPISTMVKKRGGITYLFAVGMRDGETTGTFEFSSGLKGDSRIEVVGEDRTIRAVNGGFTDTFAPYEVHIYKTVQGV